MQTADLALIGCGGISRAHQQAAAASQGRVRFVAVVDPDPARCAIRAGETGAEAFPDVEALLASATRTRVRGAVVCTPPSMRLPIIRALLAAGIPVLCEKPLAHTVVDAARLVALAAEHPQTPAVVAYCHRFTPAIQAILARTQEGEIGTPIRFENVFACWHPTMQTSWMSDPAVSGGGSLIDTACHSLDLFQHLVGRPTMEAAVLHHGWPGRGDTNATLLVSAAPDTLHAAEDAQARRVAGVISAGWAEPARFRVSLVGTHGLFEYDYEQPEALRFVGSDGQARTLAVETHETRFTHQLLAFADLIDQPLRPSRLASFSEAAEVNRVVDSAQAQHRLPAMVARAS